MRKCCRGQSIRQETASHCPVPGRRRGCGARSPTPGIGGPGSMKRATRRASARLAAGGRCTRPGCDACGATDSCAAIASTRSTSSATRAPSCGAPNPSCRKPSSSRTSAPECARRSVVRLVWSQSGSATSATGGCARGMHVPSTLAVAWCAQGRSSGMPRRRGGPWPSREARRRPRRSGKCRPGRMRRQRGPHRASRLHRGDAAPGRGNGPQRRERVGARERPRLPVRGGNRSAAASRASVLNLRQGAPSRAELSSGASQMLACDTCWARVPPLRVLSVGRLLLAASVSLVLLLPLPLLPLLPSAYFMSSLARNGASGPGIQQPAASTQCRFSFT